MQSVEPQPPWTTRRLFQYFQRLETNEKEMRDLRKEVRHIQELVMDPTVQLFLVRETNSWKMYAITNARSRDIAKVSQNAELKARTFKNGCAIGMKKC